MKRNIHLQPLALLLALTSVACNASTKENDWSKLNLKGKVKSYTQKSYQAEEKSGRIVKGAFLEYAKLPTFLGGSTFTERVNFNSEGNKVEDKNYYQNGELYKKIPTNTTKRGIGLNLATTMSRGYLTLKTYTHTMRREN